jgi:hypothetical protein
VVDALQSASMGMWTCESKPLTTPLQLGVNYSKDVTAHFTQNFPLFFV